MHTYTHVHVCVDVHVHIQYTHVYVHSSERQHASGERTTRPKGDRRVSLLHPEVCLGSERCLRKHSCKHKASLWALGPLWGNPGEVPNDVITNVSTKNALAWLRIA